MPVIMNPYSLPPKANTKPDTYCDCISICKMTSENLRSLVSSYRASNPGIISQLTSADYLMLLNDKPTTVGRVTDEAVPQIFPAGTSNQISRKHFTIAYDSDGNFTLLCLSKNGIMIDETFYGKREQPYILPQHCIIRFPSTTDVIHFKSFINETTVVPEANKGSICNHHESQVGINLVPLCTNEEMAPRTHGERPPYSYSQLIIQAISASPQKKLPLCKIYSFIMDKYPYYREFAIKSWQNSIRHNLSMKTYFLKTPQPEPNLGHLWMLHPSCEAQLRSKRFLERRSRPQTKKM
ncbi:forkhead box protein K2-like [Anopheles marshallii]|uniref:forkhead box protein K2-like n=1 Tax=Anopheles marshallii TaxID=1521116 RepID=UPI00237ADB50|nr:forkhead box protein K2-like [Anopheles marshallii]